MSRSHFTLLILLGLSLLLISGCYTKLRPPLEEETYSHDDNYDENYGYSHYYYPGYWTHSPRYGRYYALPWWIEYGWFENYSRDYYYRGDDSDRPYSGGKINPRGRFREVAPPPSGSGVGSTTGSSTTSEKQPQDNSGSEVKKQTPDSQSKESKPTRTGGRKKK